MNARQILVGRVGPGLGRGPPSELVSSPGSHPARLATSGCSNCVEFWTAFSDARALRAPGGARPIVVTKGVEAESPARLRKFRPFEVPVVMSREAWEAYAVRVPHFAVVDDPGAQVAREGAIATWSQLAMAAAGGRRPRGPHPVERQAEFRRCTGTESAGIGPSYCNESVFPASGDEWARRVSAVPPRSWPCSCVRIRSTHSVKVGAAGVSRRCAAVCRRCAGARAIPAVRVLEHDSPDAGCRGREEINPTVPDQRTRVEGEFVPARPGAASVGTAAVRH